MAFKSIGQKYGFVSAGDVYRQEIADAQAKAKKLIDEERRKAETEHQKADEERQKAENAEAELARSREDTKKVLLEMGMSDELIAKMQARLDALRQSRLLDEQHLTK